MDKQEIIKNCIFGLAVGDALGVPYEFMRRDQTQAVDLTNMKSYGYFHKQPAGAWSDDTAMTLASMDSITRSRGFAPDDMMAAFQDWYQNGAYTSTGETFGVGRTVYHALRKAQNLLPALQCGQKRFHDNGNGSLMCVALVALYCAFHDLGRADEVRLVGDASAITHAHEISKLGCLIYTDYLKLIINGINKLAAYDKCCEIDYSNAFSKKALKAYERVLHGGLPELRQHKLVESGYVVATLEAARWCVLTESTYEDTAVAAVRLGYDTDTIAAIAGSMSGILYGREAIPQKWMSDLLQKESINALCDYLRIIGRNKLKGA